MFGVYYSTKATFFLRSPYSETNVVLASIENKLNQEIGNKIITNLLLPLGHILNNIPLALESIF